jgi:hypothetical protein
MRKRPEEKFINEAVADAVDNQTIKEDLHKYVKKTRWPINPEEISPSLASGSNLRRPINLPLKENEWNSIERHVKALGIGKTEWIRHAIFKLMQEEQIYFLKNKG